MARKHYTVDFCVGDENGFSTGRVEAVDVSECVGVASELLIGLRPHVWSEKDQEWLGLPFAYETDRLNTVVAVTIGGETFPVLGGPRSGGNWSWDSVSMRLNEVCRLLNHIKAARHQWTGGETSRLFDIEMGVGNFFEWWKDERKRFMAVTRAPRWFRGLSRKRRRKRNRQMKRNLCLSYRL